jgi:hypothetical protein
MENSIKIKINWGRWMIVLTFIIGIIFHTTRLIIGVEAFQEIFTPVIDAIFTIPIVLGIIGVIMTWPYFDFRNRLEKGAIIVTLGYFIVSMPLHLQTWFTNDTGYIARFPWWYSLVFLSYSTILMIFWLRLGIQSNNYQEREYFS